MSQPQLPEGSDQKQKDYYLQLRDKVNQWFEKDGGDKPEYANYILLVPDFFYLLVKLTLDDRIPAIDKAKFAGVIAYFFSPIDVLPEALIGPLGYLDDLILTCYVLNLYINQEEEANKAVVMELWPGDQDVLITIQSVLQKADQWAGSGLLNKLKDAYNRLRK
ncbi:MAG: YkvA family protein [Desulfobacterales bacterium]|nr:YkvA family protein [Desulfobacterales bacterium]